MALRPEISIPAGLATAAVVASIYQRGLPPAADVRRADPGNADIEATRKQNAWLAAGVVGGISLIAKDPAIFIIGGTMVVAYDWFTRHANYVNPITGTVDRVLSREEQSVPTQEMDDSAYGPPDLSMVS